MRPLHFLIYRPWVSRELLSNLDSFWSLSTGFLFYTLTHHWQGGRVTTWQRKSSVLFVLVLESRFIPQYLYCFGCLHISVLLRSAFPFCLTAELMFQWKPRSCWLVVNPLPLLFVPAVFSWGCYHSLVWVPRAALCCFLQDILFMLGKIRKLDSWFLRLLSKKEKRHIWAFATKSWYTSDIQSSL